MNPALTAFPPSFEGNPWTYGFALFSMTLLAMLSVARMWGLASEARKHRHLANRFPGFMQPRLPLPMWSVLTLHETKLACLYLSIFTLTFPDVLIMLLWGEASQTTLVDLFLLDRMCDGLALFPFITAMTIGAWLAQVVPQKLISNVHQDEVKPPNWQALIPTVRIASVVMLIALGVTMGKASLG